jgi:hypothetical protein
MMGTTSGGTTAAAATTMAMDAAGIHVININMPPLTNDAYSIHHSMPSKHIH